MNPNQQHIVELYGKGELNHAKFDHFVELLPVMNKIENQWLYLNIKKWENNPLTTPIYYFNEDWLNELEYEGGTITNARDDIFPNWVDDHHIQTWLELATFEDIIDILQNTGKTATPEMMVIAINYYYEYDAFLEYDEVVARIDNH